MPLKIEMETTIIEAVLAFTPAKFWARGEATEIKAAPAVTLRARISQRIYQRGVDKASLSEKFL